MHKKLLTLSVAALVAGSMTQIASADDALAAAAGKAASAATEAAGAAGADRFSKLDTDGNGVISAEEVQADENLSANLGTIDKNGDGQIDQAEFSALETMKAE